MYAAKKPLFCPIDDTEVLILELSNCHIKI
jgi:hypothetical protein